MKCIFRNSLLLTILISIEVINSILAASAEAQPLINEIMSSNGETFEDEDGEYFDWIEIYNPGTEIIDLTGPIMEEKKERFRISIAS